MSEVFENLCPYFMSIGMSYDEYWFQNCDRVIAYKRAYDYKRKAENERLWVNGMYSLKAIGVAINNAFKGHEKYFEKPLDIYPKTLEEKQEEEKQNRKKVIDFFTSFKERWDNKHGND